MRGSTILARLDWVTKNHGAPVREQVIASLSPEHAQVVRGAVVSSLWVPFDSVMALIEAIDRVCGRGDLGLVRPLARYAARVNMPLHHRIFYKLGSVDFIMGKAAAVWSANYDSGSARSEPIPGGLCFSVHDFATPHRVHCMTILGWSEEIVALCGAHVISTRELKCRLHGARCCQFEVKYRA